jgi:hypothetical protein
MTPRGRATLFCCPAAIAIEDDTYMARGGKMMNV